MEMTGMSNGAKRNLLSMTSLLLGIIAFPLTLVISFLATGDSDFSILFIPGLLIITMGLVFGHVSLRKIRQSNGMLGGRRTSLGGVVLGYSALFASVLWASFVVVLPRAQFAILSFSNPPNYEVLLQLQETPDREVTSSVLEETEQVLSSRLRNLGAPHRIELVAPDQIIVRLLLQDVSKERNLLDLFQSKLLSFHLVHPDNERLQAQLSAPDFAPPDGYKSVVSGGEVLFVEIQPVLVNGVDDAEVETDSYTSGPKITVRFKPEVRESLARVTEENIGRRLAIMVDETLYSAPVINESLRGGSVSITGGFSIVEAYDLALALRAGAIPVPIRVIEGHFFE